MLSNFCLGGKANRLSAWATLLISGASAVWAADGAPGTKGLYIPKPPPRPYTRAAVFQIGWWGERDHEGVTGFDCHEEIVRHRGRGDSSSSQKLEKITAKVSYDGISEQYSERLRNQSSALPEMSDLDGAWSTAEFGTLLRQTQSIMQKNAPEFVGFGRYRNSWVMVYRLITNQSESAWDLKVDGQHYTIPFETQVWISTATAKVVRVARHASDIPSHLYISAVDWAVDLSDVTVEGSKWRVPVSGEYSVSYADAGDREWNTIRFSDYHRLSGWQLARLANPVLGR